MADPNSPVYMSLAAEALGHLRTAEGADRDILNGRAALDSIEERSASIRMAIETLERATA
jgi:hypothetical protein